MKPLSLARRRTKLESRSPAPTARMTLSAVSVTRIADRARVRGATMDCEPPRSDSISRGVAA